MPPTLVLPISVFDAVLGHALRVRPAGCAGVLAGHAEDPLRVVRAVELTGSGPDPTRIPPVSYLDVERSLAVDGLVPVGTYHSHGPSPAFPTELDQEDCLPGLVHLILSVPEDREPSAFCYRKDHEEGMLGAVELVLERPGQ